MTLIKVVLIGGLFMLSANSLSASAEPMTMSEMRTQCEVASGLALTIMTARQSGVSMATLLENMEESFAELPTYQGIVQSMIVLAYESPRYDTQPLQQRAQEDFENASFLACYRELMKDQ